MSDKSPTIALSRNSYTAVCLLLAGAVVAGFVGVGWGARSDTLKEFLQTRQLRKWRATNSKFQYDRGYVDFEGRLLYDEIPSADYSQGGVYFVGSSVVKNSLMVWELPPATRSLIHNYALSASGPPEWNLFLRYLIDDEGLLQAGGDKTLIVFGLCFGNFVDGWNDLKRLNEGFVPELFRRHGLYDYSATRIQRAELPAWRRLLLAEKARCQNFLQYASGHMAFRSRPPVGEAQKKKYFEIFAAHEEAKYDASLQRFAELVDYLRSQDVRVATFMSPLGSWFRGDYGELPAVQTFRQQALTLCRAKSIPVLDLESLLSDEEFCDGSHANFAGQCKMHPYLVEWALSQRATSDPSAHDEQLVVSHEAWARQLQGTPSVQREARLRRSLSRR